MANFPGYAGAVRAIAFSENGYYLASGAEDGEVREVNHLFHFLMSSSICAPSAKTVGSARAEKSEDAIDQGRKVPRESLCECNRRVFRSCALPQKLLTENCFLSCTLLVQINDVCFDDSGTYMGVAANGVAIVHVKPWTVVAEMDDSQVSKMSQLLQSFVLFSLLLTICV